MRLAVMAAGPFRGARTSVPARHPRRVHAAMITELMPPVKQASWVAAAVRLTRPFTSPSRYGVRRCSPIEDGRSSRTAAGAPRRFAARASRRAMRVSRFVVIVRSDSARWRPSRNFSAIERHLTEQTERADRGSSSYGSPVLPDAPVPRSTSRAQSRARRS